MELVKDIYFNTDKLVENDRKLNERINVILVIEVQGAKKVKELINAGKATFYIGFDATADSPTLATIIESTKPTTIKSSCSTINGPINFLKSEFENK